MERGALPFKHIHLFPSQRLIEGDGAGIEPAEGLAPQPREAREQGLLGWGVQLEEGVPSPLSASGRGGA